MRLGSVLVAAFLLSSSADAQDERGQGKDLVEIFAETCLTKGADAASIARYVDAQGQWQPTQGLPDVYENKNNDVLREWILNAQGRNLELVVSHDAKAKKLGNFCTLRFEAKERFYPYYDAFKESIEKAGLSGRNTDFPHLYQAGGKLKDGRPANAFLTTRSLKTLSKNYTTMSIQF